MLCKAVVGSHFSNRTRAPDKLGVNRMLKKYEALEKPMSTRPKMAENYLVKLLFGLILTCLVDSGT